MPDTFYKDDIKQKDITSYGTVCLYNESPQQCDSVLKYHIANTLFYYIY